MFSATPPRTALPRLFPRDPFGVSSQTRSDAKNRDAYAKRVRSRARLSRRRHSGLRGTGVSGDAYAAKVAAVEAAVATNAGLLDDPLQVLRAVGGHEIAAIAGAIIAARLAGVPVLLDGYTCTAAAAVLHAIDEHAIDHCMVGHLSAEPAHRMLCDKLNQVPLLALAMRLGEGSGAALAIQIVRAALACHKGMASFESAGVSGRTH